MKNNNLGTISKSECLNGDSLAIFVQTAKQHVEYKMDRLLTGKSKAGDAHQANTSHPKYEEAYLALKFTTSVEPHVCV